MEKFKSIIALEVEVEAEVFPDGSAATIVSAAAVRGQYRVSVINLLHTEDVCRLTNIACLMREKDNEAG